MLIDLHKIWLLLSEVNDLDKMTDEGKEVR